MAFTAFSAAFQAAFLRPDNRRIRWQATRYIGLQLSIFSDPYRYRKSPKLNILARCEPLHTQIHNTIIKLCSFVYNNMNSADLIKRLKAAGWKHVSTRGNHHKYRHPVNGKSVIVPHPKKDLPAGTAESILKHAELK